MLDAVKLHLGSKVFSHIKNYNAEYLLLKSFRVKTLMSSTVIFGMYIFIMPALNLSL